MKKLNFWASGLKSLFAAELVSETNKYTLLPGHSYERTIEELPLLLQQHIRTCGFAGRESVICCRLIWKNTFLKFSPRGNWTPVEFTQVNFVPQPARLVLMTARLWNLFSFGGRDKYQDGKGSLLIRLLGRLRVSDEKGKKMDRAELVTLLAETLILPVYALQRYIDWEQVDECTLKGTIHDGQTTASGLFTFNENGLLSRFTTNHRFYVNEEHYRAYAWTAVVSNYSCRGDLLFPSAFTATWHLPAGDHEYFKGNLTGLEFNSTVLSDGLNEPGSAAEVAPRKAEQQEDGVKLVQDREPGELGRAAEAQGSNAQNELNTQEKRRLAS